MYEKLYRLVVILRTRYESCRILKLILRVLCHVRKALTMYGVREADHGGLSQIYLAQTSVVNKKFFFFFIIIFTPFIGYIILTV